MIRSWRNVLVAEQSASATLSRSLRRRTEADGSVVYTLRVPPDDASVLDAALERARAVVLDEEGRPVETPEETELAAELVNGTPWLRADADAFVLVAESFVAVGRRVTMATGCRGGPPCRPRRPRPPTLRTSRDAYRRRSRRTSPGSAG